MPILVLMLVLWSPPARAEDPVVHLSLAQALQKAQTISVTVLTAQARVQEALARLGQAASAVKPQVSVSATEVRQSRDIRSTGIQIPGSGPYLGPFNSFDGRAKISLAIFDASALKRLKAVRSAARLSEVQLEQAQQDAVALVAALYVQARRAKEHALMLNIVLDRETRALELAKTQYRQGTGSSVAVRNARAEWLRTRSLHRSARTAAVQTRLDLAAALAISESSRIEFQGTYEVSPAQEDDSFSVAVEEARQQYQVRQADLAAERAEYMPKLTVSGDYGRSGETPRKASNTYALGVTASVPIWEGGRREAKIAEARARTDEARAVMGDEERRSRARIIQAQEHLREAIMLAQASRGEYSAVRQEADIAQQRWNNGTGGGLELQAAWARKALFEDQFKEAQAQVILARIALWHAQGRLRGEMR